ncbi:hypothetical protein RFI_14137 [Reticulomyxa filosa]|uniref:Uncharacterized protein n=1 Tax=Reticulomyxa filosa TaxID=46433 RepID=X6NBA8_RETFI|nr:hypothetical protein RFI_14137 [Reticulomyxa filosa]|eukprot:ETO23049.1 hypothetical protein RFI_14137 [Reticulomyxa filosa]
MDKMTLLQPLPACGILTAKRLRSIDLHSRSRLYVPFNENGTSSTQATNRLKNLNQENKFVRSCELLLRYEMEQEQQKKQKEREEEQKQEQSKSNMVFSNNLDNGPLTTQRRNRREILERQRKKGKEKDQDKNIDKDQQPHIGRKRKYEELRNENYNNANINHCEKGNAKENEQDKHVCDDNESKRKRAKLLPLPKSPLSLDDITQHYYHTPLNTKQHQNEKKSENQETQDDDNMAIFTKRPTK